MSNKNLMKASARYILGESTGVQIKGSSEKIKTFQEVLTNEIGVMDSTAIALCKDNKIPIVVFDIFQPGNISKAISGQLIGSKISNSS